MPKPTSELPDSQVLPAPAYEKGPYRSFSVEEKKCILAAAEQRGGSWAPFPACARDFLKKASSTP